MTSSCPRASRRRRSMARLRAVVVIQPPGLGGRPSHSHARRATANASWTASSARSMSPKARIRAAIDRPDSSRKIRPAAAASNREMALMSSSLSGLGYMSEGADLDRLRDRGAGLRRPREGGVEVVGLDDVEAAQMFLRFGEGAVGGQYVAVGDAHDRRGFGFVQGTAKEPGALRSQFLLEDANAPHELLHLLLGHRVTG